MISIKFSHEYLKMPDEISWGNGMANPTYLMAVIPFEDESCSKKFIDYDTVYIGKDPDDKEYHYELPQGKKILLLLQTESPCVDGQGAHNWTTIRRFTPEKYDYYKKHLGEKVKIEVDR